MSMGSDHCMPEWAFAFANEDYTLPGASLPTRDGRQRGNAVVVGLSLRQHTGCDPFYCVVTDAGSILNLLVSEMSSMFYPPTFIMRNLLSTHLEALAKE
jgi:hypothetical protein